MISDGPPARDPGAPGQNNPGGKTASRRVALAAKLAAILLAADGISFLVHEGKAGALAALGLLAGSLGIMAMLSWSLPRLLLALVVFVSCFEGPLKNLAPTPSTKDVVYLGRDVLLYGGLYLAFRRGELQRIWPRSIPMRSLIVAFLALVAAQLFNPRGFGPVISLLASRTYWEMIPLFFLGYALMTDLERWPPLVRVALLCGVANGIAAVVEYQKGPEWLAGLGAGYASMVTGNAARVFIDASGIARLRPPALGPDMGFAASMAFFLWPVLLGTWFHPRLRASWPVPLGVLTFLALVFGTLVSQSRSDILLSPVMIGAYLLLASRGKVARIALTAIVIAIVATVGIHLASGDFSGVFARYRSVGTLNRTINTFVTRENRFNTAFKTPFVYFTRYFWGNGMGKVGPGGGVFVPRKAYHLTNGENEALLMITETGSLATLVLLSIHLGFIRLGFRAWARAPDGPWKALVAIPLATLLAMLLLWPLGNFTTFPGNAAFWFYGGSLAALAAKFRGPLDPGGLARKGQACAY